MKQPSKEEVAAGHCGVGATSEVNREDPLQRFERLQDASVETRERLAAAVQAEQDADMEATNKEFVTRNWRKEHALRKAEVDRLREKAEAEAFGAHFHRLLLKTVKQPTMRRDFVAACAFEAAGLSLSEEEPDDERPPQFATREEAAKAMADLSGLNSVVRGEPRVVTTTERGPLGDGTRRVTRLDQSTPPEDIAARDRALDELAAKMGALPKAETVKAGSEQAKRDAHHVIAEAASQEPGEFPIIIKARTIAHAERALAGLKREDAVRFVKYAPGMAMPRPEKSAEPAAANSVEERRVRAEVADRLRAILFPSEWAPNLDLEGYLREVDARLDRNKPPLGNPPPSIVRDAALEEAAGAIMAKQYAAKMTPAAWDEGMVDAAQFVRALKSKPAPVFSGVAVSVDLGTKPDWTAVNPEKAPGTVGCATWCRAAPDHGGSCTTQHALWCIRRDHDGRCLSKPAPVDLGLSPKDEEEILTSGGGFSHVSGKTTQAGSSAFDVMQKIQADGMKRAAEKWGRGDMDGPKPERLQTHRPYPACQDPECTNTVFHQHASGGPLFTERRGLVTYTPDEDPTPEPVHDFGWALARMREGKKVRRPLWPEPDAWFCVRAEDGTFWFRGSAQKFTPEATLATDWQVSE